MTTRSGYGGKKPCLLRMGRRLSSEGSVELPGMTQNVQKYYIDIQARGTLNGWNENDIFPFRLSDQKQGLSHSILAHPTTTIDHQQLMINSPSLY